MTALEEYTAHHAETVETIMHRWPWRRFEGMFRRHLLRKAREELRQMRDLRIAAIDANMNWDSKENSEAKQRRVEGYQEAYKEGVRILYSTTAPEAQQEDAFGDDPLFNPLKQRAAALRDEASQPLVEQAGMGRQLIGATS
jgi:hypothetical protein